MLWIDEDWEWRRGENEEEVMNSVEEKSMKIEERNETEKEENRKTGKIPVKSLRLSIDTRAWISEINGRRKYLEAEKRTTIKVGKFIGVSREIWWKVKSLCIYTRCVTIEKKPLKVDFDWVGIVAPYIHA